MKGGRPKSAFPRLIPDHADSGALELHELGLEASQRKPHSRPRTALCRTSGASRPASAAPEFRSRPTSALRHTIFTHSAAIDHSKLPRSRCSSAGPKAGPRNQQVGAVYGNTSGSLTQYSCGRYHKISLLIPSYRQNPSEADLLKSSVAYDYIRNTRSGFYQSASRPLSAAGGALRYEHFNNFLEALNGKLEKEVGVRE